MNNVIHAAFNRAVPYVAEVIFDAECGMWVATCEELSVTTEAASYEALTARVWEIAPDIAEMNGLARSMRSKFHHQANHTPPAWFGPLVPADLWAFDTMRRGPMAQTMPPKQSKRWSKTQFSPYLLHK
jgi:hypothetical protein